MSFRDKVLDALNITKQSINLPVETKFFATSHGVGVTGESGYVAEGTVEAGKPYALSKRVLQKEIGNGHQRTLDVLGFQVGTEMLANEIAVKNADGTSLCTAVERPYPKCCYSSTTTVDGVSTTTLVDTGFHALKGMYESGNIKLQSMRKSAIPDLDLIGTHGGGVADHVHTEWPSPSLPNKCCTTLTMCCLFRGLSTISIP